MGWKKLEKESEVLFKPKSREKCSLYLLMLFYLRKVNESHEYSIIWQKRINVNRFKFEAK